MATPAPQWVLLPRFPRADIDSAEDAGISVALNTPPHIAELVVPRSLAAGGSRVLAADPFGFLLFSGSSVAGPLAADEPADTSYHIWDAVLNASCSIPAPKAPVSGAAGLIAFRSTVGHNNLMVAELVLSTAGGTAATLRYFSKGTDKWFQKSLRSPPVKFSWSIAHVLYIHGKLWWVDLLQGLLAFHPFARERELHFVPLPSCYQIRGGSEQGLRKGLSNDRCVNVSRSKLRLAVIARNTSLPKIKMWTLADHETGKWMLNYEVPFEDIWADKSYEITMLPKKRPALALIHPSKPHLVYFFLERHLFGVNLQTRTVTESALIGRDDDDSCGSPFLTWELPSSVKTTSSAESQPSSAFNNIADIFCAAYTCGLEYLVFHQFAEIALESLNKKIKKTKEDKFKLSERLLMRYIHEMFGTEERKYAHLNFYANSGSEKVLVFAEFYTDDETSDDNPDDWMLSSCKILIRNYQGGLYGTGVGVGQSNGTRKRKKSLYCYACEPELFHPTCGFEGGYGGSAS